jgi:hypothetical protein
MPTTNYDSSLLTRQRQSKTNSTFANLMTAQALITPGFVRSLTVGQTANGSQEVVLEKTTGCIACAVAYSNPQ